MIDHQKASFSFKYVIAGATLYILKDCLGGCGRRFSLQGGLRREKKYSLTWLKTKVKADLLSRDASSLVFLLRLFIRRLFCVFVVVGNVIIGTFSFGFSFLRFFLSGIGAIIGTSTCISTCIGSVVLVDLVPPLLLLLDALEAVVQEQELEESRMLSVLQAH